MFEMIFSLSILLGKGVGKGDELSENFFKELFISYCYFKNKKEFSSQK
jgi:hypothetical protein